MAKEINLVYQAHQKGPVIHYDGPEGKVWMSRQKREGMPNIALSYLAIPNPTPHDSLWVLEPKCINPKDYDVGWVLRFKHIFTWATKAFEGTQIEKKVIYVNHPSGKFAKKPDQLVKLWKPWNKRKNQIVIIANVKTSRHSSEIYKLRIQLADWLHANSKYNVVWYGSPPTGKPYSRGRIENKFDILNDVKFSICSENCYHPKYSYNYFTEKMPDVLFGGAVPLYMGCYNIDDFGFGKNSYIDLRKYVTKEQKSLLINFKELNKVLNNYNENDYNQTIKEIEENMRNPNGLYHVISYNRVYQTMLNAF